MEEIPVLEEVPAPEEAEAEELSPQPPAPAKGTGEKPLLVAAGVAICLAAAVLTAVVLRKHKP